MLAGWCGARGWGAVAEPRPDRGFGPDAAEAGWRSVTRCTGDGEGQPARPGHLQTEPTWWGPWAATGRVNRALRAPAAAP